MNYPKLLTPRTIENVPLQSGDIVRIPKAMPTFTLWNGKHVPDTYGGKVILEFEDHPSFAELVVLKTFVNDGWSGVWVDTFRNRFLDNYWPAHEVELAYEAHELLESIYQVANSRKGCWDVFCWRRQSFIFIECKAKGKDTIRRSQIAWVDSAIQCGMPIASFMIVEWSAI